MRQLDYREVQKLQFEMLKTFDSFCQQHNLRYQLSSGTLLGAVRHQGFIPWDDDIDLMMPNSDYFKFIDLINAKNNGGMLTERYRVADVLVKSEIPYHQTFMKIYDTATYATESSLRRNLGLQEAVFIDIFPLVGMPDDTADEDRIIEKLRFANDMAYYRSRRPRRWELNPLHPRTFLKFAKAYLKASRKPLEEWLRMYADTIKELPDSDTANKAYDVRNYLMGSRCKLDNNPWYPVIMMPFEGLECAVPASYDTLLRHFCGDYMQMPPIEKRQPAHNQLFRIREI